MPAPTDSGLGRLLTLASLVVAIVVVLHAAPLDAWDFYADDHVFDILHVIGFCGLSFWSAGRLRRVLSASGKSDTWAYGLAALAVALVAIVSEGSQLFTGRGAHLGDVGRDLSGIVAGLFLAAALARRSFAGGFLFLPAGVSAVVGLTEPVADLAAKASVFARLPAVADFEDDLQLRLFTTRGVMLDLFPAPPGFTQGWVARVRLGSSRNYPGIVIDEPLRNWSAFETFSLTVAAVGAVEGELAVRVQDEDYANAASDRFVARIPISQTPVTYRISIAEIRRAPEGREMDLRAIDRIVFDMPEADFVDFYLDDLRLE